MSPDRAKRVPETVVSVYRGCAGGYVGPGAVHPALVDAAREAVSAHREAGTVWDAYVARCGDDIGLVLLHPDGLDAAELATDVFTRAGSVGARLAQHGLNGDGRVAADGSLLPLSPRRSEPVLCFLSDKAGPGSWNAYLYRAFADPLNSGSLVTDEHAFKGFTFVTDQGTFDLPGAAYGLLRAVHERGDRVARVLSRATGEVVAAASTGADPVLVVRCESPFVAVGEVLEAFAFPFAVAGWPGGTSAGPLMPCSTTSESSSRADGPPRAVGLGFQVAGRRLVGPRDLLGDAAFDEARRQAAVAGDYLRRHGMFAPLRSGT